MVRLSCFASTRVLDEEWDEVASHLSNGSEAYADEDEGVQQQQQQQQHQQQQQQQRGSVSGGGGARSKRRPLLFPKKRELNRDAVKLRLKKILTVKKNDGVHANNAGTPAGTGDRRINDAEFLLLGRVYSELDVTADLRKIARNRTALNHLLPFILNALLYGNRENDQHVTASESNRSGKKNSSFKLTMGISRLNNNNNNNNNARSMSLNAASHLVKGEFTRQLESFLYEQAMNSVHFALECHWYCTASLFIGPQDCYHKTMTILLGMESVVTNASVPGDLFHRAGMSNSRPSSARPSMPAQIESPHINATITVEQRPNGTHVATTSSSSEPDPASSSPVSTDPASSTSADKPVSAPTPLPTPNSSTPALDVATAISSAAAREEQEQEENVEPLSVREVALDTTGNGEHDLRMHFNSLKNSDEARLSQWLEARRERANIFHAELDFIKCLTDISNGLFDIDREFRRDVLRRELDKLNGFLPVNVFIPTERRPHRVLRIVAEEAHVFSTKERVPYLLVVEVEDLAPPADQSTAQEDHGKLSALRKIGSIGTPGPSTPSTPARGNAAAAAADADDDAPNRPDEKFLFSPDVTTDAKDALMKRESSFRVETKFADDRRPPDEELLKAMGEPWAVKSERIRKDSQFGSNPNWRLVSCIVKSRDQLRQEMFAQRLIQEFARIFEKAKLPLWLRPYQILSTSSDSGLIETVTDAKSIDAIKKQSPNVVTLQDYFVGRFGGRGSTGYKAAVKKFVQSMAGYSVVQYLLNIKDRHNGNLMVDADGHIVHIDFGFFLSNSPGGNMEFEKSPFKLTSEMVEVMGGMKSSGWKLFRKLCIQGYVEACQNANKIMLMVDIAYSGNESMPCFLQGRDYVLQNMQERFGVGMSRRERATKMSRLIASANGNWTTKAYDQFQKISLGIAK